MVVRVLLMLRHFGRKELADPSLAQLFADTGIQLAHLAPLPHAIALAFEVMRRFNRPSPRARPYRQRLEDGVFWSAMLYETLPFGLTVRD